MKKIKSIVNITENPLYINGEKIDISQHRTQALFSVSEELGKYIFELPLSKGQYNKLVSLVVRQTQEAEKSGFQNGIDTGVLIWQKWLKDNRA